jgi:benzil reductase ((S)-benzoin forming)
MIIITGTSRGIGNELAKAYLAKGELVVGIGRTNTIEHKYYKHIHCDLSDANQVAQLTLPHQNEPIVFIHNAGILGEINRFSQQENAVLNLSNVIQVNFFAGVSIVAKLLQTTAPEQALTIVFISSGAGKRPIASWSAYCAAKAAVDLWLTTLMIEEQENGRNLFRCYAIAPGVVDTAMQDEIRSTKKEKFSSHSQFSTLKANGQLVPPSIVANKIIAIIDQPVFDKVICSIND